MLKASHGNPTNSSYYVRFEVLTAVNYEEHYLLGCLQRTAVNFYLTTRRHIPDRNVLQFPCFKSLYYYMLRKIHGFEFRGYKSKVSKGRGQVCLVQTVLFALLLGIAIKRTRVGECHKEPSLPGK
jgi:hypothetical protein